VTDPTTQHLYVMQNEFGCIKVGRSVDPLGRRYALRQTERCQIELVIAVQGGGEDEEGIHYRLRKHHLVGEWFAGTDAARDAVVKEFQPLAIDWKFKHDPDGAAEWLDHLHVVRAAHSTRMGITREIGILTTSEGPHELHDLDLLQIFHLAKTGTDPVINRQRIDGATRYAWRNPDTGGWEPIPAYSANVGVALSGWPDDVRPKTWDGTAIECCIAALRVIRRHLPKVPKRT